MERRRHQRAEGKGWQAETVTAGHRGGPAGPTPAARFRIRTTSKPFVRRRGIAEGFSVARAARPRKAERGGRPLVERPPPATPPRAGPGRLPGRGRGPRVGRGARRGGIPRAGATHPSIEAPSLGRRRAEEKDLQSRRVACFENAAGDGASTSAPHAALGGNESAPPRVSGGRRRVAGERRPRRRPDEATLAKGERRDFGDDAANVRAPPRDIGPGICIRPSRRFRFRSEGIGNGASRRSDSEDVVRGGRFRSPAGSYPIWRSRNFAGHAPAEGALFRSRAQIARERPLPPPRALPPAAVRPAETSRALPAAPRGRK